MRTTLSLDDDILEAARVLAAANHEALGVVVSRLARRGLRAAPVARELGLPVFAVPADAAIIPASRVAELLADDIEP